MVSYHEAWYVRMAWCHQMSYCQGKQTRKKWKNATFLYIQCLFESGYNFATEQRILDICMYFVQLNIVLQNVMLVGVRSDMSPRLRLCEEMYQFDIRLQWSLTRCGSMLANISPVISWNKKNDICVCLISAGRTSEKLPLFSVACCRSWVGVSSFAGMKRKVTCCFVLCTDNFNSCSTLLFQIIYQSNKTNKNIRFESWRSYLHGSDEFRISYRGYQQQTAAGADMHGHPSTTTWSTSSAANTVGHQHHCNVAIINVTCSTLVVVIWPPTTTSLLRCCWYLTRVRNILAFRCFLNSNLFEFLDMGLLAESVQVFCMHEMWHAFSFWATVLNLRTKPALNTICIGSWIVKLGSNWGHLVVQHLLPSCTQNYPHIHTISCFRAIIVYRCHIR